MAAHIFVPIIEAMSAAGRWEPENARGVLRWFDGLADLEEAHAVMLRAHGRAVTERFYMDPAAGAYASRLGNDFARYGESVRTARDVFHRVHAEDIRRINEPRPHELMWDISRNGE